MQHLRKTGGHILQAKSFFSPPPSIFRTLFQVRYPASPFLATLTQTPGVWVYSSHFGTAPAPSFVCASYPLLSCPPILYFFTRSFSRFFSSLMNSCTSLKSMYTDANRTYATLS